MSSLDPAIESINSYLHALTRDVGDEEKIDFFKSILVPSIEDPDSFLQPHISWSKSVHQGWEKWKASCSSQTDKIREYEEKLKKCDAYLALMQSILLEKSNSAKNIPAPVTPTKAKTVRKDLDIGNYLQKQTLPHLIINEETITPSVLSRLIRSATSQDEILKAISVAKQVTNENLCDALDREVSMSVFQALVAKIESINESALTCAIQQWRSQELLKMLNSGKTTVSPESLLKKVQSRQVMEAILTEYPDLKAKVEANSELRDRFVRPIPSPAAAVAEPKEFDYISFLLKEQKNKEALTSRLRQQAMEAVKQRNFEAARFKANSIPDETYRKGTMAEIFRKCFKYGDLEAIECALKSCQNARRESRGIYL